MRPVLFNIFNIEIYGYGFMIAVGILVAVILLDKRSKDKGYDQDKIFNMTIIAILCGVLGGKLLYIITDIKYIVENPSTLKDFGNGFVVYGAITGGAIAVYMYCKKQGWNILKVFDLAIPTVALAQGFGRIGCFLAGCCYGAPTNLPIGVEFNNSHYAPAGIKLHPTQIYSSIFDFALAVFLLWYDKKNKKEGRTFALYTILYSIGRFFVEYLRNDPRGNVGILSTSQFISLIVVVIGIIIFNLDKIKGRMEKVEK